MKVSHAFPVRLAAVSALSIAALVAAAPAMSQSRTPRQTVAAGAMQINRVAFEGNSKLKGAQIAPEMSLQDRGVFTADKAQSDVERIREIYRRNGRGAAKVSYRTVNLPNGKIDVVYTIDEGDKTGIKSIEFVGNSAYSASKLRGLMQSTEMNFLSWVKSTDVYDADRIAADQELIRRYYQRNGYADFRIVSTDVRFDAERGGYYITMTVDEGPQYRVGEIRIDSRLGNVDPARLNRHLRLSPGDVYDGAAMERSLEEITREAARQGYAFAQVRPRGDRNPGANTINLNLTVDDGPRVYIERINVRGNTRTRDYVIRREFDLGEGDAYNRILLDRAERRLNNLGYFKKVRITNEPGSSPDRVIVNVDVEDQSTGSFSISGGYSTSDGFLAELSVTETNFLGRGQYVRLAVSNGQRSRGIDFSFTEPYFMDRRLAAGFDLFHKQTDNSKYSRYENWVTGGTIRFGVPITEEITISPRYSLYSSKIKIPNEAAKPFNDCSFPIDGTTPGYGSLAGVTLSEYYNCLANGEASLAIKEAQGTRLTSMPGYSLQYNSLDNVKTPTRGIYAELRQDIAGLGGNSRFIRTTGDIRVYREIIDDVVGFVRLQGGNITGFGNEKLRIVDNFNLGPSLVRGFAPGGIGPRDISNPIDTKSNPLGGTTYFGGSVEVQFPIWGLPREIGLKGAVFADAGTLFGYKGTKEFSAYLNLPAGAPCVGTNVAPRYTQGNCITVADDRKIRSSVGASLIWNSPLGPIRFDWAYPLTKGKYDVTQFFRFSGGTSF
ncbi:MAG: outer membrane protein assembly factor BamA [Methylobacteriaceae bacterium]|nr:outer membrane protein assembly factor BamA [Methylobacteriaceae bacterium]